MTQYFVDFSDKSCCFEDLKPYVDVLSTNELDRFLVFLNEQIPSTRSTLAEVQRTINVYKLQRFAVSTQRTADAEHNDALKYLKAYFQSLPVGALFHVALI